MRKATLWITVGCIGVYVLSIAAQHLIALSLYGTSGMGTGWTFYSPYGSSSDWFQTLMVEVIFPLQHWTFNIGMAALIVHLVFLNREFVSLGRVIDEPIHGALHEGGE